MKKFFMTGLALLFVVIASGCRPAEAPQTGATATAAAPAVAPDKTARGNWDQVVVLAKKEGRVSLYGEMTASVRAAISEGIKQKYGIDVEVTIGKSPELAQKYLTERRANLFLADAFIIGAGTALTKFKPENVLANMGPMVIDPEAANLKAWPNGKISFIDAQNSAAPLAARYASFVIRNVDSVKEDEIKSYRDLLSPKWKGKITMFDPTLTGSASTWTTLVLEKALGWDEGKKYLQEFAKQEPVIIKDARLHVEWVARGKYPIGVGPNFGDVAELQNMGVPISWVRVAEGGMMHPGAGFLAIPDKTAHPSATLALVNWLFGVQGQEAFSKVYGAPPIRLDASKEGFDPMIIPRPGDKLYWLDESFVNAQQKAIALGKEIFGPAAK